MADNKEIRNIHKMNVQNEENLINLLYDRKANLARKLNSNKIKNSFSRAMKHKKYIFDIRLLME